MYFLGYPYLLEETARTYRRIITFYEELITLKAKDVPSIVNEDTLSQAVSHLYELTLLKYGWLRELLTF